MTQIDTFALTTLFHIAYLATAYLGVMSVFFIWGGQSLQNKAVGIVGLILSIINALMLIVHT